MQKIKNLIILIGIFNFILTGCSSQELNKENKSKEINSTNEMALNDQVESKNDSKKLGSDEIKTFQLDGIIFKAPSNYQQRIQENSFSSFGEYITNLKENYIREQIRSNYQNQISEAEIENKLKEFNGHYSFEEREVNGINTLVHRRDFYGMIGAVYEVHIETKDKILILNEEFDHEKLDKILLTIEKI